MLQLSVIGVTASVIGHWLSVSITSGFSQDLDKEICAAAQKKAEEEKVRREAEKRKKEEERKEREEERKEGEREKEMTLREQVRERERGKEPKRGKMCGKLGR